MSGLLPDGFAALEPFVEKWAGGTTAIRARLRDAASAEDAAAFYGAARPLIEAALARLDARPLSEHSDAEQRLMQLVLTFAHVSLAIEVQEKDEPVHAKMRRYMCITRAPADFQATAREVPP